MKIDKNSCEHFLRCCIAGKLCSESIDCNDELVSGEIQYGAYVLILSDMKHIYIGSGNLYERKCSHISKLRNNVHKNYKLQANYNLLNNKKFMFCTFPTLDRNIAFALEQQLLDKFKNYEYLTNIATNAIYSGIGLKRSKELVDEIIKRNTGKKFSDETRKKMSIKRKLRIISEETKKKISLSNMNKCVSEDTRRKISLIRRGKKHSEACKQNMSIDKINKYKDPEFKLKMLDILSKAHAKNMKPISIDGITYRKISDAAIVFNLSPQTITSRINDNRFPNWLFL